MVRNTFHVCVRCITYNHAEYIEEALNGFCMQQTTFPFVCVIIDDYSTDGEQYKIKKYLLENFNVDNTDLTKNDTTDDYEFIFTQHKLNHNCYFAVYYLKYNHYSINKDKYSYINEWQDNAKYIALCEGDDYWIDSRKLQKQVDFMEEHPNYSMCFHNAIKINTQNNSVCLFNDFRESHDLSVHDAIHTWKVPTASIFVKQNVIPYPSWMAKIYSGDYAIILRALNAGNIFGLKDIMSVYRISFKGSSLTAKTYRNGIFVIEQHLLLLNSFNKGSNFKFEREVNKHINDLKKELRFQKQKNRRSILIFLNPKFWVRLSYKLKVFIIKIIVNEKI